ncbi:hypothetical protein GGX14DRAFT_394593 [Mycena pura]|uniref:Uncharacterized protein n=1 Tax=Mycena pura TaxID=153505 RepID=A0AAD6VI37_9AGAR|nr:hypothetical protein GGX14DRAFT_394593 [Mycena pura]
MGRWLCHPCGAAGQGARPQFRGGDGGTETTGACPDVSAQTRRSHGGRWVGCPRWLCHPCGAAGQGARPQYRGGDGGTETTGACPDVSAQTWRSRGGRWAGCPRWLCHLCGAAGQGARPQYRGGDGGTETTGGCPDVSAQMRRSRGGRWAGCPSWLCRPCGAAGQGTGRPPQYCGGEGGTETTGAHPDDNAQSARAGSSAPGARAAAGLFGTVPSFPVMPAGRQWEGMNGIDGKRWCREAAYKPLGQTRPVRCQKRILDTFRERPATRTQVARVDLKSAFKSSRVELQARLEFDSELFQVDLQPTRVDSSRVKTSYEHRQLPGVRRRVQDYDRSSFRMPDSKESGHVTETNDVAVDREPELKRAQQIGVNMSTEFEQVEQLRMEARAGNVGPASNGIPARNKQVLIFSLGSNVKKN